MCWASRADNRACAHFACGVGKALVRGAGAMTDGSNGYHTAFSCGEVEVLSVKERNATSSVENQRFELVDPADALRVVQPDEPIPDGASSPPRPYRVRSGQEGAGRVAAGLPRHLEDSRVPRSSAGRSLGRPKKAARIGWCALIVLAALVGAAMVASMAPPAAPPRPVPLVTIDSSGALHLEASALARVRDAPGPLCVLGVTGPAGEGKSTLANAAIEALGTAAATSAAPSTSSRWLTSLLGVRWGDAATRHLGDATSASLGGAQAAVWMWSTGAPNATVASTSSGGACGSVLVLDSAGVTGGLRGGSGASSALSPPEMTTGSMEVAQSRMLTFLMLTANRVVVNARRQPTKALLERLVSASISALRMRPPVESHATTASTTSSTDWPPAPALAPPASPTEAGGGNNACVAALPAPACESARAAHTSADGVSRAELVLLLRDAQFSLTEGSGRALSERQVMERWLPGSAGQLVDAATDTWRLMQLPPPSRIELEHLHGQSGGGEGSGGGSGGGGDGGSGSATTAWGAKLAELARSVTNGMRPGGWEAGGGSDGAALAGWMEKVVGQLNTLGVGSLMGAAGAQ